MRIVKDHLNAKNVTAANIPITRNMISNVKAARARYFEGIGQKNKEENQSKVNLKRKIVSDEITDIQKKKACLEENINDLIKNVDKPAFEAETKTDLKLLGRSNDLQKICRTKKKELDDLQKIEHELLLRIETFT